MRGNLLTEGTESIDQDDDFSSQNQSTNITISVNKN